MDVNRQSRSLDARDAGTGCRPVPDAPSILTRCRDRVGPALRTAVGRLSAEVSLPVAYHFGWVDADGRSTGHEGTSKGLRPSLALLSSEASGGTATTALPGAVAVELIHNASLLHDDIMDGDRTRRHQRATWTVFGVDRAIIAGDALLVLAQEVLLEVPGQAGCEAGRRLLHAMSRMISGQADDLAFESTRDVPLDRCLQMAADKAGALLSCAATIGAVLNGAPAASIEALERYGHHLGLAFQAVDDLLGIWGDPAVTGKPTFSDLRQRKKTVPIAAALGQGGPAAQQLLDLYARNDLDDAALREAAGLVERAGGQTATVELARAHLEAAVAALDERDLDRGAADKLAALASFVCSRTR